MVDIPTIPISDDEEEDRFHTLRADRLADHHVIILNALQDAATGKGPRNVMMMLPPGSAKSTYADVVFAPWFMTVNKRKNVILTSYGSDLARKQGRRARALLQGPSFQALFPDVELSKASSAADEWALTNGSEFMSGGILSGITGNRAHGLIIDDPVKGRQEAESETIREKTLEAYRDDVLSRLVPGGWQAIITTRWHESDLAGCILPENWSGESGDIMCRDGEIWRVIAIPAQAERDDDPLGRGHGEYIWPEWFDEGHWQRFKRNPRTWSSLFQQRPAPEQGTFFQREWFNWYDPDAPPKHLRMFGSSDYALTEDDGDWTELGVFGIDPDSDIYVGDWWSGQTTADVWIDAELQLVKRNKPLAWFSESGPIRRATEPFITRRMRETKIFCRREWIAVSGLGDKATRARAFQARASMGKVYLPNNEAGHALLDQLLRFPAGAHDDKVDTCALIGMALDQAHPAMGPTRAEKTRRRERYSDIDDEGGASWKTI